MTRAQMAVFLARLFDDVIMRVAPVGVFTDVPIDVAYASAVEAVFSSGVTLGCGVSPEMLYCPTAKVTRGQLASFLVRVLDI